ncbi:MAG: hypothetical protein ACWGPS_05455, partial [Candidatus Promineifilaceae bacterium]
SGCLPPDCFNLVSARLRSAGLSRLVEQEILREVADEGTPLYEVRIGLVGLWVNQNKSLSRLYEKAKLPQVAR